MDNSRKKDKIRIDSVIGYNVRAEREMRKITREELAESMDLTVSHMGLIERGERGATAVTLEKLARVFEVPVDNFFAEPEVVRLSLHEDGRDDDGLLSAKRLKIS
ncbi:MAG: helix-turn-helix transcriptional regulator, partial [Defluviitaleaceae bacterium]|nr:helix-turn-helix transcriptional regulator [Defluviitaleaceae bacterium]